MSTPDTVSQITHTDGGTTIVGPDAMLFYKAAQLKGFIGLYIKCGMIPTRGVTISKMLKMATEITKKPYKNTDDGRRQAEADLQTWVNTMKAALPIEDKRTK
jgi:hypothetical protein